MKRILALLSILSSLTLSAADGPWQSQASSVTFAWDEYPLADHHIRIYASTEPGAYFAATRFDAPPGATQFTAVGLDPGVTWYFVATAVDPHGLESLPTEEISLPNSRATAPLGFTIREVVVSTTLRPR